MKLLAGILFLLCSGCARSDDQGCYSRPADFMHAQDWLKDMLPPVTLPERNVIKVHRSGAVTWNGADLRTHHGWTPTLKLYLELVPQLKPQPLTFLDWEQGAPCDTIQAVRSVMREHLTCDGSRTCLQGPVP